MSRGNPLFKGTLPSQGSTGTAPTPGPTQDTDADFTYSRKGVSRNVDLNGSPAADPDGGALATYEWDVGDDGSIDYTGRTVTNADVEADEAVTLVVTDDEGATNETTKTVL